MFRRLLLAAILLVSHAHGAWAAGFSLDLESSKSVGATNSSEPTMPEQLPHSMVTFGTGRIERAWLARGTPRYAHGVLGDELEASRLVLRPVGSGAMHFDLPTHRVFEDLAARLVDLDSDGVEEAVVVESDANLGASLAVYGIDGDRIGLRTRSPFIGRANRWLNPVGAGDFDGDGRIDLALVRTPHIGGVLELYRFATPQLELMARASGYSTHQIGSTELGLGAVVNSSPRDLLLVPNQARSQLVLLAFLNGELAEQARLSLPGRLETSLIRLREGVFYVDLGGAGSQRVSITLADGYAFRR